MSLGKVLTERPENCHPRVEHWTGFNYHKRVIVRRYSDGRFAKIEKSEAQR